MVFEYAFSMRPACSLWSFWASFLPLTLTPSLTHCTALRSLLHWLTFQQRTNERTNERTVSVSRIFFQQGAPAHCTSIHPSIHSFVRSLQQDKMGWDGMDGLGWVGLGCLGCWFVCLFVCLFVGDGRTTAAAADDGGRRCIGALTHWRTHALAHRRTYYLRPSFITCLLTCLLTHLLACLLTYLLSYQGGFLTRVGHQ